MRHVGEPHEYQDCPHWCAATHSPKWTVHTRNCGEVKLGSVTYSIDVSQYREDEYPVIGLCIFTDEDVRASNCTKDEAYRIYTALGKAIAFLEAPAARRAIDRQPHASA